MRKRCLLVLLIIVACLFLAAISSETHFTPRFNNLNAVKQAYGERPGKAVRSILFDPNAGDETWRDAAFACTFLGSEGADLLVERLTDAMRRKDYGRRTGILLKMLGFLEDAGVAETAMSVLTQPSPQSLKGSAAEVVTRQVEAAFWNKSQSWKLPNGEEKCATAFTGSTLETGAMQSSGRPLAYEAGIALRVKLADLLARTPKKDDVLRKKITQAIEAIDRKDRILQEQLDKLVQENSSK